MQKQRTAKISCPLLFPFACSAIILVLFRSLAPCALRVSAFVSTPIAARTKTISQQSISRVRLLATATATTMSTSTTLTNKKVEHIPAQLCPSWMLKERTRVLNSIQEFPSDKEDGSGGCVVYWMQRDVRTADNWALLLAAHWAETQQVPLRVLYALPPPPPPPPADSSDNDNEIPDLLHLPMTERHGKFLLGGLECVYNELKEWNVPLDVVLPKGHEHVGEAVVECCLKDKSCRAVVTDMAPLRHHRQWTELQAAPLLQQARVPFVQVDTHNVVPVWITSDKREYAARTIRTKIHKHYGTFLQKFPKASKEFGFEHNKQVELPAFKKTVYEDFLEMDDSVKELDWAKPGTDAALKQAQFFFDNGLKKFNEQRNNPNERHAISNLSPWINHGHVSFQRLALAVKKLNKYPNGTAAYIEEGVVRRELSDNYVYYAPNDYDALSAAYGWAQETLQAHASDPREHVYTLPQFERGATHDDLWNAAQLQAVRDGKMHGFLRMYWCKKILEWTESPAVALQTALYLNDKFNIDGRDPNGFVGVGWSIMGIHDQGKKTKATHSNGNVKL